MLDRATLLAGRRFALFGLATMPPLEEGTLFRTVRGKTLVAVAADHGCRSWAQHFLRWILAYPAVRCWIPASNRLDHLEDDMAARMSLLSAPGEPPALAPPAEFRESAPAARRRRRARTVAAQTPPDAPGIARWTERFVCISTTIITVHHLGMSRSQRIPWQPEEIGVPYEIKLYIRDRLTRLTPPKLKQVHPQGACSVLCRKVQAKSVMSAALLFTVATLPAAIPTVMIARRKNRSRELGVLFAQSLPLVRLR